MSEQKYEPLEDRVLILPYTKSEEEKLASGIIKPMTVERETMEGEVVAVGVGYTARDTGVFVQTVLAKGDKVLFGKDAGMVIEIPGEEGKLVEHKLMREGDVLLLISKKVQS